MKIWFSSDFHFGHKNIAGPEVSSWKAGYRNFKSVHEMNKELTTTINKYVEKDDIMWFLGDFSFGGHTDIPVYRHSISCQNIHLIRGNHDSRIDKYKNLFLSINDVGWCKERTDRPIFMSHYAHRVWQHSHKGVIHLYGHSHNTIPIYGKSMDVGVDVAYAMFGEYRPFSLDEILNIMDKQPVNVVDHHDTRE